MARHDARDSKSLKAALKRLGATRTVSEVLDLLPKLTPEEKETVVEQTIVMFDQFNVHMPMKRARHAIDPVQRLRLLAPKAATMEEIPFHGEMIRIFKSLRDAHTNYGLPRPLRGSVAFLPFLLEAFFEDGIRRFLVTRLLMGFKHSYFRPGVEVTHWNGTPIERAVLANAEREDGSNEAARFAFGLADMTVRSLSTSLPPDEEWVTVTFQDRGQLHEIVLPWRVWDTVADPPPDLGSDDPSDAGRMSEEQLQYSANERAAETHRARMRLFAPKAVAAAERIAPVTKAVREAGRAIGDLDLAGVDVTRIDLEAESVLPDVFQFSVYEMDGARFGYIRIRTFAHSPIPQFLNEFLRILALMPAGGLIVDVRGNSGGLVLNSEILLQTLTGGPVEPEPFQFINTPLTLAVCTPAKGGVSPTVAQRRAELAATFGESIAQSLETGAVHSSAAPITPSYFMSALGQWYHGPATLVTDAMSYSATDLFAAGFKDHAIGTILGVDTHTGAGGANVWEHDRDLVPLLPAESSPFRSLPAGVAMRVSARRSLRIGRHAGQPLEELGVRPDILHLTTRSDLLEGNIDLITRAVTHLSTQPGRRLDVEIGAGDGGRQALVVTTHNIDRLDCYVADRPMLTKDLADGATALEVPLDGEAPQFIDLRGYRGGRLVANRRVPIATG